MSSQRFTHTKLSLHFLLFWFCIIINQLVIHYFIFVSEFTFLFAFFILLDSSLKLYVASVHSSILVSLLHGRVLINFFNVLNFDCHISSGYAQWRMLIVRYGNVNIIQSLSISLPFFPLPSLTLLLLLLLFFHFLLFLLLLLFLLVVVVVVVGFIAGSG